MARVQAVSDTVTLDTEQEPEDLGPYLDLAGCEGGARERAVSFAPPNFTAELGWYLLERR